MVSASALRSAPSRLLKTLVAQLRAQVYVADPDDPVLGRRLARLLAATADAPSTGCAAATTSAGGPGALPTWPSSSPIPDRR